MSICTLGVDTCCLKVKIPATSSAQCYRSRKKDFGRVPTFSHTYYHRSYPITEDRTYPPLCHGTVTVFQTLMTIVTLHADGKRA